MDYKIAVVDDDKHIAELIGLYLKKNKYDYRLYHDGITFLQDIGNYEPHLILLDVMLPGINGFDLKASKQIECPIIYVTARSAIEDRINGLKLGADDYVIKPFDGNELLARIEAVLRRVYGQSEQTALSLPALHIELASREVYYEGTPLTLPQKEYDLLRFLVTNKNQVFTREQLIEHVWGLDSTCDNRTVDVHIKRLREKLKGDHDWTIKTVWGVGYKLQV